ncbi:MAG: hypothetical protein R3314_09625, partial [Longimicrobiales bacterium]|nr:hypothetical protein [Longimicrobiales bacterium]
MSRPAVTAVGFLLVLGACDGLGERLRTEPGGELGRDIIIADTVDAALLRPGTVLRFGPAADHVVQGPLYSPVVVGDRGQVSIYEGFFVPEPCARSLRADADREGDTITV